MSRGAFVGPPTAFLRRSTGAPWVSLPGPPVCPPMPGQDGIGDKAPNLCGCCREEMWSSCSWPWSCFTCKTENAYTKSGEGPNPEKVEKQRVGGLGVGGPDGGCPEAGAQHFAFFVPSLHRKISLFLLSLVVFFVELWQRSKAMIHPKCAFGLLGGHFILCEPRRTQRPPNDLREPKRAYEK